MLKRFRRKSATTTQARSDVATTRADLQIRNLLDDPALRRAMGLDKVPSSAPLPAPARAEPRELQSAA